MVCSKRFVLRGVLGLGVAMGAAGQGAAQASPPAAKPPSGDPAAAAAPTAPPADPVRAALQKATQLDVADLPLSDLAALLEKQHGIQIQLDSKALEDAGVAVDTPVTISIQGVTLGSALRHVLRQQDLTWAVSNGVLVITTPEEAEQSYLETRVYPVADLVAPRTFSLSADDNAEALLDVITATVAPENWDDVGGPGAARHRGGALVVTQTQEVHEQLAGLLGALREARGKHPAAVILPPVADDNAQRVRQAIDDALARPIELELTDVPLSDLVAMLIQQRAIPVLLDTKALEDAGVSGDTAFTLSIRGLPLEAALWHLFRQADLTWMVRDEALVITTPEKAERVGLEIRVFPVANLLRSNSGEDEANSFDDLIATVQDTVAADSWDEVGGAGGLEPEPGARALVCLQTAEIQAQVAKLLAELERARLSQPEAAQWASADDQRLELRVHPLVLKQEDRSLGDANSIALLVQEFVAPDSWQGGAGVSVRPLGDRLVVRQTNRLQREVAGLLRKLGVSPPEPPKPTNVGGSFFFHSGVPARPSEEVQSVESCE